MRTLVAWDDPAQAELLGLYLGGEGNEAAICTTREEFAEQRDKGNWNVVFMSLTFPTNAEEGFKQYEEILETMPGIPVVLAARSSEMLNLPRFMTKGLRFYLVRDDNGDFLFLALTSLESAVQASRAEEAKKLASLLREEMDGVRRMQESIIPKGLKPPPGYFITARYEPAQVAVVGEQPVVMAGGDYYDLFRPDNSILALLVGDASGHGLKACMSIMAMHTLIRMFTGSRYIETAAFVGEINHRLCENSIVQSGGGFITLFYTAIDTSKHMMHWTSAGHPLALLQNMKTNEIIPVGTEDQTGLPLGIYPDVEYTACSIAIPPASRLLVYSDGLTDALPPQGTGAMGQAFGIKGLCDTLKAARDQELDLDATLEKLFQDSLAFTGGVGRHDDTSVVLLERCASS